MNPMANPVELVLDTKAELGEGPIWHAPTQRLYWVNIMQGEVHVYDPGTNTDRAISVGQSVGTVVPRRSGGVMLALNHGFASLDLESGAVSLLVDPEKHLPANRFNDGKCDPAGRFWAGTMLNGAGESDPPHGSLYSLDANHQVRQRLGHLRISNGIVWSLDKRTMYFVDSPDRRVDAFDYDDATGEIGKRRVAVTIAREYGMPDGMTIDAEGMLWVAGWGGGQVSRWHPATGKFLETIKVPASQSSACAFGGPNLDELYITSARIGLDAATLANEPHAGGLFVARPGVKGTEAFEFAG
jgi:sugar lactone lactonase YvrE